MIVKSINELVSVEIDTAFYLLYRIRPSYAYDFAMYTCGDCAGMEISMKLSEEDKKVFINHISELLENEQLFEMDQYIQHGNTTTFTHCLIVSYYSYVFSLRLPFNFDRKSIIRGAMMHDFYLYDWHVPDKSHRLHGFKHPEFALTNAKKHFVLTPIETDIISKHMWPLTLRKIPIYKEALLVCMVDKLCSFTETFYMPVMPRELRQLKRLLSLSRAYINL